jgi:hypothetical protein
MIEAANTSASPAAIWTVCAVALACLAFWLTAVTIASRGGVTARRARATPSRGSASRHKPTEGASPPRATAGPLVEAVGVKSADEPVGVKPADEAMGVKPADEPVGAGRSGEAAQTNLAGEATETRTAGEAIAAAPVGGTRVPASGAVRILGDDEPWVPGQRTGESEKAEQGEKTEQIEEAKQIEKTEQAERIEKTEQTEEAKQTGHWS